eukprot:6260129-Amphidinium_carterae.2
MSPASLARTLKEMKHVDTTLTRSSIPKPGRKPAAIQPPMNACPAFFINAEQRDAGTMHHDAEK